MFQKGKHLVFGCSPCRKYETSPDPTHPMPYPTSMWHMKALQSLCDSLLEVGMESCRNRQSCPLPKGLHSVQTFPLWSFNLLRTLRVTGKLISDGFLSFKASTTFSGLCLGSRCRDPFSGIHQTLLPATSLHFHPLLSTHTYPQLRRV